MKAALILYPFCAALLLPCIASASPLTGTSVASWGDGSANRLPMKQAAFPRQDGDYTRQLSYTKIDAAGKPLADGAPSWNCVRDNVTGLIWEVKSSDGGLHGKEHTYTWFNPDETVNGGVEGREGDTGDVTCGLPPVVAEGCDTVKYVAAVNAAGWCGHRDWRLPTVDELSSIVNYGRSLPAISTDYFPDIVMPAGFWSSTPSAAGPSYAWIAIYDDGYLGTCVKSWNYYLRLVRGGNE